MTIDIDKFKRKGRFRGIRRVYFQQRSGSHILKLQKLTNDIDSVMTLLENLQCRTGEYNLVAPRLKWLSMRMYYMNNRKLFRSDQAIFRAIGEQYFMCTMKVQRIILDKWVNDAKFLSSEKDL